MNIVIIGGSRGIGKAAAAMLAKDGHRLLLVGRNAESLEHVKKELPEYDIFPADITKERDVYDLTEYIDAHFPIDGLILNAAAFPSPQTSRSVLKSSVQELTDILDANVVAHYRLVQLLFPLFQKQGGGRIVLIGSTAGIRKDKGGVYGISKWALRSFAYNLREEAKEYGVGVSLVNPGGVFTENRKKQSETDTRLLETSDLGIMIATIFKLSPQAVVEQIDIRPLLGDTY